jgi:hypothetical protein
MDRECRVPAVIRSVPMKAAVAYYIGADPALTRQKDAVRGYAAAHRLKIARDFWDADDESPVAERTGFAALLAHVLGGGAKVALVDNMDRVAPDPAAQVTAHTLFERYKVELVPVSKDWVAAKAQVLLQAKRIMFGDVVSSVLETNSAFEKHGRLAKLCVGRDKRSAQLGYRVEGNPAWGRFNPEHVEAARRLKSAGKSLRQISAELAKLGYLNNASKPYGAESIARMLRGDLPGINVRGGTRA